VRGSTTALATGLGVCLLMSLVELRAPRPHPRSAAAHASPASEASPITPAREPSPVALVSQDDSSDALLHVLDPSRGEDDVLRLEAIDALVARRHVPALGRLLTLDPAAEPNVAPTLLAAIGELGRASPDPALRRAALDRLLGLLAEEKARNGADSVGNVLTIVESLGALAHPDAAPALERELSDPYYDVAGQAVIVTALGRLGARSSGRLLAQLRADATSAPSEEPFTRKLEDELVATIDEALRGVRAER
jgi:hypothetical protein